MKNFNDLSSHFLLSLVTEKNMSLNTASSYKADLNIFFEFINQQKLNVKALQQTEINKFFQNQREKGFSDNTISRRLSTLKQFFKFLVREGFLIKTLVKTLKTLKVQKKYPVSYLREKC